jgi:hypothetical protein
MHDTFTLDPAAIAWLGQHGRRSRRLYAWLYA